MNHTEHKLNHKYFIDKSKLNKNVLEIRYVKNRHLTNIKSQMISNEVKKILQDVINNGTFDTKDFYKLPNVEQHLMRTVLSMLDLSDVLDGDDDAFGKKFEILKGELASGNNSQLLKHKLKQYIMHGLKIGRIPQHEAFSMLLEL